MRFTSKVSLLNFDKRAYLAHLDEVMIENTKEAAREWLETVLAIIPVWSEASHATFNELAEAVGFNILYGRSVSKKNRKLLGFREGRGGLDLKGKGEWYFYYISTLRYLNWNEYNHAVKGDGSGVFGQLRNPGPYKFQEAGENVFRSFAENVKLPSPIPFITAKRI